MQKLVPTKDSTDNKIVNALIKQKVLNLMAK